MHPYQVHPLEEDMTLKVGKCNLFSAVWAGELSRQGGCEVLNCDLVWVEFGGVVENSSHSALLFICRNFYLHVRT